MLLSLPLKYLISYVHGSVFNIESIKNTYFDQLLVLPLVKILLNLVILTVSSSFFFSSIWVFFHKHSRITGLQGKREGILFTSPYHFHPFDRHLDISRAITTESSPLHIASSRARTRNLWSPRASR